MAADRVIPHGLLQKARIDAAAVDLCIRPGVGRWTVWRMGPAGWVWNAEFADRADAEDYLVGKLPPPPDHV